MTDDVLSAEELASLRGRVERNIVPLEWTATTKEPSRE